MAVVIPPLADVPHSTMRSGSIPSSPACAVTKRRAHLTSCTHAGQVASMLSRYSTLISA